MNILAPFKYLSNPDYEERLKELGVNLTKDPLSKGTFKRVYATSDPKKVAVLSSPRTSPYQPALISSATRESLFLQALRGAPHIPVCYESFSVPNERYCLIEENFCENEKDLSLTTRLNLREIREVAKNCLQALVYMHARRIGHFDIKPANMTKQGLIDFGSSEQLTAKESDGRFATLNGETGTSIFWPPEVVFVQKKYLVSDLFSLGLSLFEIFTGIPFFIPTRPHHEDPLQHDIEQLRAYEVKMGVKFCFNEAIKECFSEDGTLKKGRKEPLSPLSFDLRAAALESGINPSSDPNFLAFEDLLKQMLVADWTQRITAKKALEHPFFEKT